MNTDSDTQGCRETLLRIGISGELQKSNLQRGFQQPHLSLLVSLGLISMLAWANKV